MNINIIFKNYKNFKYKKIFFFFFIIVGLKIYSLIIKENYLLLNSNYSKFQKDYHINFIDNIKNKINIGIYTFGIKNGGRARTTSILIN